MPKTYADPTRVSLTNFWTDYPGDEGHAMFTQPDEFAVPVTALLARAADTLRTLVVLQRCDVRLPPVRCHLPALRELALLGNDGLFMHASPLPSGSIPGTDDSQGAPFPNLQRLHVVYTWPRSCSWEDTLPRWSELAPAVTHLRISQGGAKVAQMVRDMLELSMPPLSGSRDTVQSDEDGTEPDAAAPALTYPSLRLVIVQPSRAPYSASSATAAKMLALRREVEEVAAVCAEEDTSMAWVSVLRSRLYDGEYWPRRLQREWRDRMMGGGGCWTEDEYDEDERWGVSPIQPLPKRDGPLALDLRRDRPRDPPEPKKWWQILCSIPCDFIPPAVPVTLTLNVLLLARTV
ncbi:uncharacterized protein TRAVEDRAFT_43279 [Trametes versicolor FP-101664 SS1]|uniref:uncharacterized protein n=1 Tax=Trametes versicolor (strain FP-101664) TaxID=717944 RepID=UPI0004623EE9|nr:uncharacterized protein TRAVEDRAFT_43279 [Trametes versicolor FP-101664 SS1]EIW62969.1 hypothetical protein TRAVEDRAFT_43279 [Trametes versicolor FP-101664 SS1]